MDDLDLSQVSLPHLIVELLLDGRARYLLALLPFEPISVTDILTELHRRTGEEFGADKHAWRDWFLNTHPAEEDGRWWVTYAETTRRIRIFERRARRRATSAPTDPET